MFVAIGLGIDVLFAKISIVVEIPVDYNVGSSNGSHGVLDEELI